MGVSGSGKSTLGIALGKTLSIPFLEGDDFHPKANIDNAINTSAEILKRIPDFPKFMDKANYALQLIAEGKLNIGVKNSKSLEIEQMKLKNLRNNILISFLGVVIFVLVVF